MRVNPKPESGTTLSELMMTALVVVTFFASIFEVNAVCLRYINASKESIAALQGVQDRLEVLRNVSFTELLSSPEMVSLLTTPANEAPLTRAVREIVTVTDFATGSPSVTYTRTPGASVTPTYVWSSGTSFPETTEIVKVKVRYEWTSALGSRARNEEVETFVSTGIKK